MPKVAPAGRTSGSRGSNDTSLAESVYRTLRHEILYGAFQPGQRIREVEIAAQLHVSRTPVRQALHRLESEDLLTAAPQGLIVTQLGVEQVLELYAVREVLEGAAAAFAARSATPADIEMLEHIVLEEGSPALSLDDSVKLNQDFHIALYYAAHNRYLLKTLNALLDAFRLLRQTTLSSPGRIETSVKEHRAIVKAIIGRNPETAEDAARRHIREAQRQRLKLLMKVRPASSPSRSQT